MSSVRSSWADRVISISGVLSSAEWSGAGRMPIPAGYLMVKNDSNYMYVALDMVGDRGSDAGTGDYFWFSIDVDGNRQITGKRDVNYSLYRNEPNRLGRQYFLGPGRWTGLLNEPSTSRVHIGFGPSPNSSTPHRIWEMRLALEELGVDLSTLDSPPVLRFGVRVSSTTPRFTYDYPTNFYLDFTNLHEIILARAPEAHYPAGTAGAVIGGVGLIPASEIVGGYATTDPSYYLHVDEAAFGGRMHLIGNRVTMQDLWNRGGRKYRILHSFGTSSSFAPIRQSWSNYRWDGTRYVLEHFGPDEEDRYAMLNPGQDYSVDDLLLQWHSVGSPAGIHQFRAEFFTPDGHPVTAPNQVLALMVDNNLPTVDVVDILHNGSSVPACAIERMLTNDDGVQVRITVNDSEGHLRWYDLRAHYGDGSVAAIASDSYSNHRTPTHRWEGVTNAVVPSGEWVPPVTCAYQFRLRAYPRVTNGYHYIGYTEDTRHITLIKPASMAVLTPRISSEFPLGILTSNKIGAEGEEPAELGKETIR